MDADTDAAMLADLRDAAMSDMAMRDVVRWADTASQHAVRQQGTGEGLVEASEAAVNADRVDLTIGSSGHRSSKALDFR
jgi:hypothetical protein